MCSGVLLDVSHPTLFFVGSLDFLLFMDVTEIFIPSALLCMEISGASETMLRIVYESPLLI